MAETSTSHYSVVPQNLPRFLKRYIDNTAKRGLRPEEIVTLGLSKASQKKHTKAGH